MAIARFRGIIVVLAALMLFSVFSTALAAERSHAGKSPDRGNWGAYSSAERGFTLGVGSAPPVENSDGVLQTHSSPDPPPSVPGYCEASVTITSPLLSRIPKDAAARRIGDLVQIARSHTVQSRAAETLYRDRVTNDTGNLLQTLRVEPEPRNNYKL